jgi:hypothetical protein
LAAAFAGLAAALAGLVAGLDFAVFVAFTGMSFVWLLVLFTYWH